MRRSFQALPAFLVAVFVAACSSSSQNNNNNGGGGSSAVSVSVSPGSVSVIIGESTGFTATVTGTTNTAVTWEVNDVAGGNATFGTISTAGNYTAPASVPNPAGVTIKAVSQADTNKAGTASATIVASQSNQDAQSLPIKLGTTGSNANDFRSLSAGQIECCTGTLGSLLLRNGALFVLSNTHVIARADAASIGDNVIQPGLGDNNCTSSGANVVGHLSQFANLENSSTNVDAAIAQVVSGTVDTSGAILSLGATASGSSADAGPPHAGPGIVPTVGMAVAKSGRTTGLTCSTVSAVNVQTSVQYEKGCGGTTFNKTFTGQISVLGGSFSLEGDSGSLIVSEASADPVALLYGGSDTDSVGNPVSDVLTAMADAQGNKPNFVGSAATHQVIGCTLPSVQAANRTIEPQAAVTVSSEAVQKAAAARDTYAAQLLQNPYVHALGVTASLDHPGEPAVLVAVNVGQPKVVLPAQLDGVRTRIVPARSTTTRGVLTNAESAALTPATAVFSVSALSGAEISRAKTAQSAHVAQLMRLAGVQGVGITSSADAPGEAALLIFTIRGVAQDPIPDILDGVRTRIRNSSPFKAGLGGAKRRACVMPPSKSAPRLTRDGPPVGIFLLFLKPPWA